MTEKNYRQHSQLIGVLREGVTVIQMVLFKELRSFLAKKYPEKSSQDRSMLCGAIINTLFGAENPEEKFKAFNRRNHAVIEQELLGLAEHFQHLLPGITDALRVQTLCDHQEGVPASEVLKQAEELGILIVDRDVPLPSTFMTSVRGLGEQYDLTIAPVQIPPEQDTFTQ